MRPWGIRDSFRERERLMLDIALYQDYFDCIAVLIAV